MTIDEIIKHCDNYITSMNKYADIGNIGWWLEFYHTVLNGFREIKALEAQPTDAVKCDCTTEEIIKSFTEDVEAVKDKLLKSSKDCRNCKKWNECPCGKEGHENGTSIGYSIGECKDYEPCEDAVSREAVLSLQTEYAEKMDATTFWKLRDDIRKLPPVTPQRPKGKWLHIYKSDIACECSVCHIQMPITEYFHYCPNCGANMSGGEEDENNSGC